MERRSHSAVLAGGITAWMLFTMSNDASAQNSIRGRVKDENNRPLVRPLNAFAAAEVEAFEFHPKDWSGTLAPRLQGCTRNGGVARDLGGLVVWLRRRH